MTKYEAFKAAHDRAHAAELATKTVYCLCGREFSEGTVSRIAYGSVQYADNRCGQCSRTVTTTAETGDAAQNITDQECIPQPSQCGRRMASRNDYQSCPKCGTRWYANETLPCPHCEIRRGSIEYPPKSSA